MSTANKLQLDVWCHLVNAYVVKAWCGWLGRWCVSYLLSRVQLFISACNGRPH